jgi:hypothetical protein
MAKSAQTSDLFRAKRGVAVLAACIVQTASESDPSFETRFLERLRHAYGLIRDNEDGTWEGDVIQELELLSWTRELLTGWNPVSGKVPVFLKNYQP